MENIKYANILTPFQFQTSRAPGHAAETAEAKKKRKYEFLEDSYSFVPAAIETFGPWGPSGKALFSKIGKELKENTFAPRSYEFSCQRLSIAVQRGNAASGMGTVPHMKGLEEIYYVLRVSDSSDI